MNNKLSNTQLNMYSECPTKYKYHYVERLRPNETGGALIFGSAIDKATEAMILGKPDYIETFLKVFKQQEINGVLTDLDNTDKVNFANSDFDVDLIYESDKINIPQVWAIVYKKEEVGYDGLSIQEKIIFNRACWTCLKNKGLLMLDMCSKEILPNIEEVLGTQVKIDLTNESGDSVTGFADFVGRYKGYKDPIIFDFKTSSKDYDPDAVLTSQQLALYKHALSDKYSNTKKAGFIVLLKKPLKDKKKVCKECGFDGTGKNFKTCNNTTETGDRCNGEWKETVSLKMLHQVIINDIPDQTENIVLENFDMINQSIKHGIFHRNFGNCKKQYGKMFIKCPYFSKCYHNSDEGLSKIENKT